MSPSPPVTHISLPPPSSSPSSPSPSPSPSPSSSEDSSPSDSSPIKKKMRMDDPKPLTSSFSSSSSISSSSSSSSSSSFSSSSSPSSLSSSSPSPSPIQKAEGEQNRFGAVPVVQTSKIVPYSSLELTDASKKKINKILSRKDPEGNIQVTEISLEKYKPHVEKCSEKIIKQHHRSAIRTKKYTMPIELKVYQRNAEFAVKIVQEYLTELGIKFDKNEREFEINDLFENGSRDLPDDILFYLLNDDKEFSSKTLDKTTNDWKKTKDDVIFEEAKKYKHKLMLIDKCWPGSESGGKINVQRKVSNQDLTSRDKIMWKAFYTAIHEYLHTITHTNFIKRGAEEKIEYGTSILEEGFTDLFAKKISDWFADKYLYINVSENIVDKNEHRFTLKKPHETQVKRYPQMSEAEQILGILSSDTHLRKFVNTNEIDVINVLLSAYLDGNLNVLGLDPIKGEEQSD